MEPMVVMIWIYLLIARCFAFLEYVEFLSFSECTPKILYGFMWRVHEKSSISNSKTTNKDLIV
jgi:hypothetical protein